MKLNFVFLAFLLMSMTLAQDYSKQASCIRDTLNKLSQDGRIHAFGIRATQESSIKIDSLQVGAEYSRLTSKLVSQVQDPSVAPKVIESDAAITSTDREVIYADMKTTEQDPLRDVVDGCVKQSKVTEGAAMQTEIKEREKEDAQNTLKDEIIKMSIIQSQLIADKAKVEELLKQLTVESSEAKREELSQTISEITTTVKKIQHQKAQIEKSVEIAKEIISEAQKEEKAQEDIPAEAQEQVVVINGQRIVKKLEAQKQVLEEQVQIEKLAIQRLEDKLKLVQDSKTAETITNEINKIQVKVEKLEEQTVKVDTQIRVTETKVEIAKQQITKIEQETKKAVLEEIKQYGTQCTSYSIRPSVKICIKWNTASNVAESENQSHRVCAEWKEMYRESKCEEKDASGKCIKMTYVTSPEVNRYECESHSTEFPKMHCMEWKSENGKAVCIKTETFYQARTCVEFVQVGNEIKCGRYEGAYPAFKCIKTMIVDGEKVCRESGAYIPYYYCKEYMMVGEHRYCQKRELFFGTETVAFKCEEKEQIKDSTGEIHCMKFSAKKLEEFKDFKVEPINSSTFKIVEKTEKIIEREVKRIDMRIIKEEATVHQIEKKIVELKKTIEKVTTSSEVNLIKKIIAAEKQRAEVIRHSMEIQKQVRDKIKSDETTIERKIVQIKGEIKDNRGRIIFESETINNCSLIIKEANDQLKTETDQTKIEQIKRTITEESLKMREANIKIITIEQEIQEKEVQIKETKINTKVVELELKKKDTQNLIKETTEKITHAKEQLIEIRKAIMTSTIEDERDKLIKKYNIITEKIKVSKHDLKTIKRDVEKMNIEEIVVIKRTTTTEVENLKKKIRIITDAITKLRTEVERIVEITKTTNKQTENIEKVIKELIKKETIINERIDRINKKSELEIHTLEEETVPKIIRETTKILTPPTHETVVVPPTIHTIPPTSTPPHKTTVVIEPPTYTGEPPVTTTTTTITRKEKPTEPHTSNTTTTTRKEKRTSTCKMETTIDIPIISESYRDIEISVNSNATCQEENFRRHRRSKNAITTTIYRKPTEHETSTTTTTTQEKPTESHTSTTTTEEGENSSTCKMETTIDIPVRGEGYRDIEISVNSNAICQGENFRRHIRSKNAITTTQKRRHSNKSTCRKDTTIEIPIRGKRTRFEDSTTSETTCKKVSCHHRYTSTPKREYGSNFQTSTKRRPLNMRREVIVRKFNTPVEHKIIRKQRASKACVLNTRINIPINMRFKNNASYTVTSGKATRLGLSGITAEVTEQKSCDSGRVSRRRYGARGLQAAVNAQDVSLVKTFNAHLATFRPADRALINKCLV